MSNYPKIFLAVDNCFASKRWVSPRDWMPLINKLGLRYIEASADNECDPFYADPDYLKEWISEISEISARTGIKVANLYSGHGTYSTLGLAHPDPRIRDRMHFDWLEKMLDTAKALQCGLGFFCHAFDLRTMFTPDAYRKAHSDLLDRLSRIADYAARIGVSTVAVEQMYTPHQIPWTISGTESLLRDVYAGKNKNFYVTIDTGHQSGQHKFIRPDQDKLRRIVAQYKKTRRFDEAWIGPDAVYETIQSHVQCSVDETIACVNVQLDEYSYLFAAESDCDTYAWIEKLGAFSPIIHLQQTDGLHSAHLPFNADCNKNGIIKGDRLLHSLAKAFTQEYTNMPEKCREIFLTLEIFAGTSDLPHDILSRVEDSVAYWRQFVPEDGMTLDALCARLSQTSSFDGRLNDLNRDIRFGCR